MHQDSLIRRYSLTGGIPSDPLIMENEIYGKTAIEHKTDSEIADIFRDVATRIYENKETVSPTPLTKDELSGLAQRIRRRRGTHIGDRMFEKGGTCHTCVTPFGM
ncbi:MAG: hypothetical protein U9N46_03215 [Euryarchaeota archaeon]|nr:hypothetical protein [Euryarchaeota archaeon]